MYRVRYARVGEQHVAYQAFGSGSLNLVLAPPVISNVETQWMDARFAAFAERLASFANVAVFDKRGTGLSDPIIGTGVPTLEERMDDIRAVMAALEWNEAALFGYAEGGPLCVLFAATFPERTTSLVLCNTAARLMRADDYPWAWVLAQTPMDEAAAHWGDEEALEPFFATFAPGLAGEPDWPAVVQNLARGLRSGASPMIYAQLQRVAREIDVRGVLPSVRCPVLVLHRADDRILDVQHGRYLAEHIQDARYRELAGADHYPYMSDAESILDEVQEFLTGVRPAPEVDRVLCTLLFTDIVGSTQRAAAIGDHAWKEVLAQHHAVVRSQLERYRGKEIDTTGDGFLATFDGPARAVRCAIAIREAVRTIGLRIRAGVHTGECEFMGDNIGGLAVHIGARVGALASENEILVSSTVKDLVAGSGLSFEDRGTHAPRGVPEPWRIFAVSGP
jgi:class 3 adenylate cyclase